MPSLSTGFCTFVLSHIQRPICLASLQPLGHLHSFDSKVELAATWAEFSGTFSHSDKNVGIGASVRFPVLDMIYCLVLGDTSGRFSEEFLLHRAPLVLKCHCGSIESRRVWVPLPVYLLKSCLHGRP